MRFFALRFLFGALGGTLLALGLHADTYDTRTLLRVFPGDPSQVSLLDECHFDIVSKEGESYKVLALPEEITLLTTRGVSFEVLSEEMARDRDLWRDALAEGRAPGAVSYYTASKFDAVNPPAGSLMRHLLDLQVANPSITRLYDIGDSQDGAFDIVAMKVSANPDMAEAEPKLRIYANIHGDEKGALMVACDALDWILANYPSDPDARTLVEGSEMWFIPMGNPWGNANSSRYNSRGVDLNRNFWGPNGNDQGAPFSESETQAIRDLTEVTGKRFAAGLSFHGGAVCFNSVYNYTSTATTDEPIFFTARTGGPQGEAFPAPEGLAEAYQQGCTTPGFWYTNGADWYITRGDTNDWSYNRWSTIDTTLEATLTKTPSASEIPVYTAQHQRAVVLYLLKALQGVHGVMSDASSGAPLQGTVRVTATASSLVQVPHDYQAVYTDPAVGDFHRVLSPGAYTVTCEAPGYAPTILQGVVVSAGSGTTVACAMGKTVLRLETVTLSDLCETGGTGSGDGTLDPGETGSLLLSLSNPGSIPATGIVSTLFSASPFGVVVTPSASFPDIAGGGSATSNAPHFRFFVSNDAPCGTVLPFTLQTTSAQGNWSEEFFLTVGQPQTGGGTLWSEGFESTTFPPNGWQRVDTSGTFGDWRRATGTTDPPGGSPHGGGALTVFNASTARNGNSTRLYQTSGAMLPASAVSANLSFWMLHDTGYPLKDDRLQVQLSGDGASWSNVVGGLFHRNDGSSGWKQHTVDLTGFIGTRVYVGFLGVSALGNDVHLDDAAVSYQQPAECVSQPCTATLPGEVAPGRWLSEALLWIGKGMVQWPIEPKTALYRLYRGEQDGLEHLLDGQLDSCLVRSGESLSATVLADPPPGGLYWFLVTGENSAGEGSAGSASSGVRILNSAGSCP